MTPAMKAMRFDIVTVTPEVATEWLARPWARQRTLSGAVVAKYARAMEEGRWEEPSLDPIGFTPDGELGNGQHRLQAVIKSGWRGDMLVAFDVPPENFLVMDTGRKRQATQFVRLQNASLVTAAVRIILWYDRVRPKPLGGGSATSFDNDEVIGFIDEHAEGLEAVARRARAVYKHTEIPGSVHAGALFIALRDGVDPEVVEDWTNGLETGVGLRPGDPRLALRDWAVRHKNASRADQWMAVVTALNAHIHGRTMLRIQRGDGEPPVIKTVGRYQRKATSDRTRHAAKAARVGAANRGLVYEPPTPKAAH